MAEEASAWSSLPAEGITFIDGQDSRGISLLQNLWDRDNLSTKDKDLPQHVLCSEYQMAPHPKPPKQHTPLQPWLSSDDISFPDHTPVGAEQDKAYHFFKYNCENLVMKATVDRSVSLQVDDALRKLLVYSRSTVKPVGIAIGTSGFKATQKGATKAAMVAATSTVHRHTGAATIHTAGGKYTGSAVAKAATTRGPAHAGGFRLGWDVATQPMSLGMAAGVSALVAIPTEAAVLAYFSMKHRRMRELGLISDAQLKKEIVKEHCIAVNTATLSILGAVAGTAAIPVPVLGASIGGFLGCLGGQLIGTAEGKLFELAYDYTFGECVSLPKVRRHTFSDCSSSVTKSDK